MKASFWTSTEEIVTQIAKEKTITPAETSYDFCETILSGNVLKKKRISKQVSFYMLSGAHEEWVIDRNGIYVPSGTERNEQACGYLTAVAEYMEQLKQLGLYDNSTIVVTTDHGTKSHPQGIFLIKCKSETHDEMQVNHATVFQKDVMMTVLDSIGLDYTKYGVSAFDREENDELERYVRFWENDDSLPDVGGEYNAIYLYSYTGDGQKLDQELADGKQPTEIIPLVDSWYKLIYGIYKN